MCFSIVICEENSQMSAGILHVLLMLISLHQGRNKMAYDRQGHDLNACCKLGNACMSSLKTARQEGVMYMHAILKLNTI